MIRTLTNEEMRLADRHTIDDLGVPSLVLMERAGRAIADEAERVLKTLSDSRVIVVCGGGNNGGDGFVAARILLERGYDVTVVCFASNFSEDCRAVASLYDGKILSDFPEGGAGMVVDCLFGTGMSRNVEGKNAEIIEKINETSAFVLSADIPSGLNGSNGKIMGTAVRADMTVTIAEMKQGLVLNDGRDCCGRIIRADIGILPAGEITSYIVEEEDVKKLFLFRKSNSNKGSYGRAAIIAGSALYSGAALLAAKACLRTGAGYTALCVPHALFSSFVGVLPEVLLKEFSGADFHEADEEELSGLLSFPCIAIGPGCGATEEIYKTTAWLLKHYTGALVVDADALNALAKFGVSVLKEKTCEVVLTPHVKEFSRLTQKTVAQIVEDGVRIAKEFAREYGATVLLKSNTSVVVDSDRAAFVTEGTPALAKGGSGDVLSGILASLLAQKKPLFEAAYGASFVLGRAAVLAERETSEYSVVASDVIDHIGKAIASIRNR